MDFQNQDSSYHRRLGLISGIVITTLCVTVLAGQRYVLDNQPKLVGWRGEMQLLPEISIEPEVAVVPAEHDPAPKVHTASGGFVLPVAKQESQFAIDAPAEDKTAREPGEGAIDDLEARGSSTSQALHAAHPGSYSDTYIILRTVKPRYPEHERERGIEGSVTVELLIDEQGNVAHADVLELVGPPSFQNSALDAVRQFEFQPPIENGVATTMWIKFVIKFRINS